MSSEHPDEGTIHAWLDGALGDAEAARVAAHVAGCAPCAAAVAEARGLIAGASRVVRALDEPAGPARPFAVLEAGTGRSAAGGGGTEVRPIAGRLRVTPGRAAIAATLLVAIGLTLSRRNVARESEVATLSTGNGASSARSAPAMAPAVAAAPPRDALLDSAIGRAVAKAVPPRSLDRPADAGLPRAERAEVATVDTAAAERVAVGRQADVARRDSAPVAADNVMAMSKKASAGVSAGAAMSVSKAMPLRPEGGESQCLRVESPVSGARWGTVTLPVVVTLDSAGGDAGTARVSGTDGEMHATWRRLGGDSVAIDLREAGTAGHMELAGAGRVLGGTMRSLAMAPPSPAEAAPVMREPAAPSPAPATAQRAQTRRARPQTSPSAASSAPAPMGAAVEVRATRCR